MLTVSSYAHKAMNLTGMAMNVNGHWEERRLLSKLQQIFQTFRVHFDETPGESD